MILYGFSCANFLTGKFAKYQSFEEAQEAQKLTEQKFFPAVHAGYANYTVKDLMDLHIKQCPETRVNEKKVCLELFLGRFGNAPIRDVSKVELVRWLSDIKESRSLSVKTLKLWAGHINHFFDYLVDRDILNFSPMRKIRFPSDASIPRRRNRVILTEEEIKIILENAKFFWPAYFHPFLTVLAHTGARRGELLNLRWRDVDFSRGTLTFCGTKNGDDRTIKVPERVLEIIKAMPRRCPFVFTNDEGLPIGYSQLHWYQNVFQRIFTPHKKWGFHSFRHSFAHQFLKKGGEMYQLQAILGHRDILMTINLYGQLQASEIENPSPYDF